MKQKSRIFLEIWFTRLDSNKVRWKHLFLGFLPLEFGTKVNNSLTDIYQVYHVFHHFVYAKRMLDPLGMSAKTKVNKITEVTYITEVIVVTEVTDVSPT